MSRFLLLTGALALMGLASCEEKGPIIEMGKGGVSADSTYVVADIPTPQKHNVLVEEFTGATCTNCPAARDFLKDVSESNDNRLIVMGIHPNGIGQATPVHDSKYDLRTEKGTSIMNAYYSDIQGIPAAGFDRVKVNGVSALLKLKWADAINARLAKPSPVNIELKSSVDESARKGTVEVKITYTEALAGNHKLSLVVIEDSIIDAQEHSGKPIEWDYNFMHTFRDYITAVNGDPILENIAQKEAGRTLVRTISNFELKEDWKIKNLKLIAFVHYEDGDKREVLQAAEVHLGE